MFEQTEVLYYWIDYKKMIAYCIYKIIDFKEDNNKSDIRFQESKYYGIS